MNITTANLFFGATLFAFALTACAGSDGAPSADGPQASASSDGTGSTPPPSSSSTSSSGGATPSPSVPAAAQDSGAAAPTRTLALQCQTQAPTSNAICLETAEGRAGDIVDLEVHLLRPAACGPAEYAMGSIEVDPAKFELVNPVDQQDCLQRSQSASFSDPTVDVIFWQAHDKTIAPVGCTASAGVGNVDIIKVRIKPNTPAGDYDLPFESSELLGGGPSCSGVFLDVAGKIRVLP